MRSSCVASAVGAALVLGVVEVATAGEGRREINQACAAAGCFPGDSPGFPVTLPSGSFVLTGDLVVSDPSQDAIAFLTPPASIDLNGFEIIGPVTCSDSRPVTCGPAGNGIGIRGGPRVVVSNGRVRGFASGGIQLAERGRVEGVTVETNGGPGILTADTSIVSHCIARQNGGNGIRVGSSSIVEESIAVGNGSSGIASHTVGAVVTGSTAFNNGIHGIESFFAALIQGNIAHDNALFGIAAGPGSTVSDNTAYHNDGDGIQVGEGSTVSRNTVHSNGGWGISLFAGATYRKNTVHSDTGATVTGGVNMLDNSCNGNPTCP